MGARRESSSILRRKCGEAGGAHWSSSLVQVLSRRHLLLGLLISILQDPRAGSVQFFKQEEKSTPQQTPGHAHMEDSSILQRNGPCARDRGPEQARAMTKKRTKRFAKQTLQVGKGAPNPLAVVHHQGFDTTCSWQLQRTDKTPFGAAGPCREDSAPEELPLSQICMKSGPVRVSF